MRSRLLAAALAALVAVPAFAQSTQQKPPAKDPTPKALETPAVPTPTKPAPVATTVTAPEQPLPVDPKVVIGTLSNGLRYYIRQNPKPEHRAELRLVVNAGSILEDSTQLGLAHFVEHTAFNGTTHFRKNELIQYLESIGVRFGADLNANTGFDQTVYILPIPTDTARLVDRAFEILEDWAHGQTFDSTEVVNERGVVLEEWRGGQGAGQRMLRQWLPIAFKGSRYAERLPIGTEQSILHAQPSVLRRFYQDWYRPDLQAVIAVGDFDPERIETLIKEHFGGIPKPATPRERTLAPVPDNAAPLVAIATDPEATSTSVQLLFKRPHEETKTIGDYRRELVEELYTGMLNARFDEIAQRPDAPFLGAGASEGPLFSRSKDAFFLSAGVREGEATRGIEALLTEAKRVDQFGFLGSELARQKRDMLRGYERAYAEREKTLSSAYVDEYVQHYLMGDAIPGIAAEWALVQQLLPTITLEELNALARQWITDSNRVVIVQAPRKTGVAVPTEGDVLAAFDKVAKATITPWTETLSEAPLVPTRPAAGKVVATRAIPAVGVTEWRLSNGARVLVKPTDFKADEVLFTAYSDGGTSLVPDSLLMSANFAAQVAGIGGLGQFSDVDLQKKLAGTAASVSASISETGEGLSGSASPKDLETLFELAYLRFTAPRLDTAAFQAFRNRVAPFLANRGNVPEQVFGDTVGATMSRHSPRRPLFTAANFAKVDPAKSIAIYRSRFANAADFTFLFVGNVDTTTLRPLVERWLGALPGTPGRREHWRDVGVVPPAGVVARTVRKGVEPKASTVFLFTGPFTYTPENRLQLRALTEVMQLRLNETLREQLGGTYSPSISGGGSRAPRPQYTIDIEYGSSPENVEKLAKSVFAIIDTLRTKGPSAADVEKVKEQLLRTREVQLKQNGYWLQNLAARDQAGEDLAGLLAPYDAMVRAITPAMVRAAAVRYLDPKHHARFVLLPEGAPVTGH